MDDFFKRRDKIVNEVLCENLLLNKEDLYLNFEKFENGECNFCLLTGLVGSGIQQKAVELANKYTTSNIDCYEIRLSDVYMPPQQEEFRDGFLKNFLKVYKSDVEEMVNRGLTNRERNKLVLDYLCFCIDLATLNKPTRFIIHGPEVFWMYQYVKGIEDFPLIFLNTPLIKATLSDAKERIQMGQSPKDVLKMLIKYRKVYKNDHDIFQNMQRILVDVKLKKEIK